MVPLVMSWLVYWIHQAGRFSMTEVKIGPFGKFGDAIETAIDGSMDVYIILVAASMLMAAFSRERDEDEYVASVRGRYLMLAFYVDFVFVFITSLMVHDLDYPYIMSVQMFMILFLHIVMFNIAMAVIRRRRSHEE